MESKSSKMETDMKVNFLMIKGMAKVNISGLMEEYMMDSGRMGSNMVQGCISRMVYKCREFGKKVREYSENIYMYFKSNKRQV